MSTSRWGASRSRYLNIRASVAIARDPNSFEFLKGKRK
jgi:hypothetical protein